MKSTVLTISALILFATVGWTTEAPTIEFDPDLVRFVGESGVVGYAEYEPVSVGITLTLPGRSYFIALDDGLDASDVSFKVSQTVASTGSILFLPLFDSWMVMMRFLKSTSAHFRLRISPLLMPLCRAVRRMGRKPSLAAASSR